MPMPQFELAVMLVITSVISAGYYLRLVTIMFMRRRARTAARPHRRPRRPVDPVRSSGSAWCCCSALGLVPGYLVSWTSKSAPAVANRPC